MEKDAIVGQNSQRNAGEDEPMVGDAVAKTSRSMDQAGKVEESLIEFGMFSKIID